MERDEVVSCLFCASPCAIDNNDDSCQYQEIVSSSDGPPPSPPLFQEDSPPVREQLKSLFILRRILHIPNEGLAQFLGEREGSSQPELWAKVCNSCGPLVRQFYDTFKDVARLERILEGLETELKGRIVESKEKELKGPTAKVLEEIRSHVLQEQEGAENEFLDKDFAEYLVQEWVVEDPVASGELMDLSNLVVPTFSISEPYSGGSSRSKPPVDLNEFHGSDDDSNWIGHVVNESSSLSPVRPRKRKRVYKTRKRSGKENAAQRYKPSSKKKRRKLNIPQKPVYSCKKCPYKTHNSITFKKHGFCHERNSGAERCEECLAYFLPYKIHSHRYNCKLLIQKTVGSERMLNAGARKRKKHSFIQSNPNYMLYRRGKAMNHYYLCLKCPYETSQHVRIEAHVNLHEEGTGVACGECEWYLRPEMMEIHEKNNHSGRRERQEEKGQKEEEENGRKKEEEEKEDYESSAPLKYQCSQCPYETRHKQLLDNHLAVHQKKEGQEKCDACGWVFSKMGLAAHRKSCRGSRTSLGSPSGREAVKETEQKLNGGDQRVNYACSQCPYEHRDKMFFEKHLTLHQQKKDAETCEGCQVVFSKMGLLAHRQYCKGSRRRSAKYSMRAKN